MRTANDSLAERYGAPSRSHRALVVALAALIIVPASAWLVWTTVAHADPAVASAVVGHEIVDDHTATVTARIDYGDGPVPATCSARAIAPNKTVVGEIAFQPDADQVEFTVELATDSRATTVEWLGCTAEGQPRPR